MSPVQSAGAPVGDTEGRGTAGDLQEVQRHHPTSGFFANQEAGFNRLRQRIARWLAPADQVFSRDLSLLLDQLTQYQDGRHQQLEILGNAARMCRKASELHDGLAESEPDWLKAEVHRDFAKQSREVLFALKTEVARLYLIRSKVRSA